jgi:tetratricopeptide (TPR) repeat protein
MMRGFLTVALAALLAAPVLAESDADVQALLASGDAAMRGLDPAAAAVPYEQAALLAPDSYEAVSKAAFALRDAGEALKAKGDKAAEGYFERASTRAKALLARFPDRAEAHYLVASTSGQLALYRGAREKVRLSREIEKEAKAAVALDPADARPHAVLGVYYREVANANGFTKLLARTLLGGLPDGTNEDAVRELTKATQLDPNDLYAAYELARTYRIMDRRDEERAALEKVLALPVTAERDPRLKKQAEDRIAELGTR